MSTSLSAHNGCVALFEGDGDLVGNTNSFSRRRHNEIIKQTVQKEKNMNKKHDGQETILTAAAVGKRLRMKEVQDAVYSSRRERKELLLRQKQELHALVVNNKHQKKRLVEKHLNQKLHYKKQSTFKEQRQKQRQNLFAKQRIHKEETRAKQKQERKKLLSRHEKMERRLQTLKVKFGNACIAQLETVASPKLVAASSNHEKKKKPLRTDARCDSKTKSCSSKNTKNLVIESDKDELHDVAILIPLPIQQRTSRSTKVLEVEGEYSPIEESDVPAIVGMGAKTITQLEASQEDDYPELMVNMGSIGLHRARPNPTLLPWSYAAAVENGPVRHPMNSAA